MQALKDGKLEGNLKSATTTRENLSKDLVQATSEMTNKKSAHAAEVKALEAAKKVSKHLRLTVSFRPLVFLSTPYRGREGDGWGRLNFISITRTAGPRIDRLCWVWKEGSIQYDSLA